MRVLQNSLKKFPPLARLRVPYWRVRGAILRRWCHCVRVWGALRGPAGHRLSLYASFAWHWVSLWTRAVRVRVCRPGREVVVIALVRHMGDIVACEPVARRVEELSPGAYVIWCVQRRYRELLTHNPHVAWAMGVSCLTEWRWLARSAAFNRAIDLHIDGQSCPVCCVPHVKPESRGVTMANYYQHGNLLTVFTKCAGLDIPQEAPRVYIDERTRHIVDGLGLKRDYVVLHCTTSHAERCWPREKWLELVEWLHAEEGLVTVEVGTEAVVPSGAGGKHHDLCGKLSVLGTAEVIRRGLLFVGLDSGPAHLANAMETAGVILLGRFNTFTRYLP